MRLGILRTARVNDFNRVGNRIALRRISLYGMRRHQLRAPRNE